MLETALGDPPSQIVQVTCGDQLVQNTTAFSLNFASTMENINQQMQASGFGVAVKGSDPDTNYGLGQCYEDLSLLDCELCYAEECTDIPQCYPYNSGRIYLNGCFMRYENYSFFQENTRPGDRAVFGNTTGKNPTFKESVKQALNRAIVAAPHQIGHATAQEAVLGVVNESVYVLADCWMTLNASSCKACLENSSASILECLPQSKGRALNTGCFMRKAGANTDCSLNFKYSTLEKATGAFDNANKLGQGGFGTVYKGILPDGREVAVKRLFFNKRQRAVDFYNEINIISSVEHKNLVRLLGCGCSGPESLLVYELLPKKVKSLDQFLFDMPPEYLAYGHLTKMVDVYSFGVLPLEIVTGRQNNKGKTLEYSDSLITTTWKHFLSGTVEQLYDPNLMLHNQHNNNVENEISREVHIGLLSVLCTQEIHH
ncbi:cysteine-rich receptor-like protein kinase 2 [Quercus suber]|uniref:Cysteine-rich receptor-like protein kinase 2 n=1 Tax=Quercus suber TaxID=58331 RepID=A0AAW0LXR1_QUESU